MYYLDRFTNWGMRKLRSFTVGDVAAFKCCIFLFGLLTGSYFARSLKKLRPVLWLFAAVSYLYLIWRMVVHDET